MLGNNRFAPAGNAHRVVPPPPPPPQPQPTRPPTDSAALLKPAEAARRLGVSERVLERWRGNGAGPVYVRLGGKTLRYRSGDLETFINASVRRSTAG